MKLFYEKTEYVVDGTLAIQTWWNGDGYWVPYGDVTVNLSAYGMKPEEGYIYMPTYKMSPEYANQIIDDIVEKIVGEVQIGYGKGLYVKLKKDWESNVEMMKGECE